MPHMNSLQSRMWPRTLIHTSNITGICPWTNKCPMLYIMSHHTTNVLTQNYCTCQSKKQEIATYNDHAIATYVPPTNMPLICHICQYLHVQMWDNHASIDASYKLNAINNLTTNNGVHTFTLLAHGSEQTCMSHYTCMSHCITNLVYMYTPDYWTYK